MDATNPCTRCGTDAGPDVPQPSACSNCSAVACATCGDSDDRICPCWISLEGMARADIKAILTRGGFTVDMVGSPGQRGDA